MKIKKNIIIASFLLVSFIGFSQSKNETGSSSYYDFYEPSETAIYGMKTYLKDNTFYLFITDAFPLCSSFSKSDTYNLNSDLEAYIEANYNDVIDGADKYVNCGGLSGYTHICYFFEKENSSSSNFTDAKRGRTNAMAQFNKERDKAKIIKISRLDFDFNLPCN